MKINLVNYEERHNIKDGILSKYAYKMHEELLKLGEASKVSPNPDPTADVNHHINYLPYEYTDTINTLMLTHLLSSDYQRFQMLTKHIETADMGICFSAAMTNRFIHQGLPKDKLTYVLPAHDGMKRRPTVVAILTKVYADGRKREHMVLELAKTLDKEKFAFRIMGFGWRGIVEELHKIGFTQVEYFEEFNLEIHKAILDSSDYVLYTGEEDEGAMSILDAVNAGVKTIAPLQGFHFDLGIDYPFNTQEQLNDIFKKLAVNRVEDWTWEKYTKEHLAIWKKLYKAHGKRTK